MVTHKDIAQAVGVSQATVSKVLSNRSNNISISPKTRQAVIDAAKRLGYNKDKVAAGLIHLVDRSVAILMEHIANPFLTVILSSIEKELAQTDYRYLFASADGRAEQSMGTIESLTRRYTTGFILMPFYESNTSQAVHEYLKVRGIPFVQCNYFTLPGPNDAPLITTNNFSAFKQLTEHLIRLGHTNIALCYTSPEYSCMDARLRGYIAAHEENGLKVDSSLMANIPRSSYLDISTKEELLDKWLRRRRQPTAIMCFKDDPALQLIRLLSQRGLSVPGDMAVTGFDDYRYYTHTFHPEAYFHLTTVRQDLPGIGREAVRRLISEIENGGRRELPLEIEVPGRLIVRGSCGGTKIENETDEYYPLISMIGRAV